ncbi:MULTISPECIES: DUF1002 domain-containing protein [Aerococcus]|uniref:DUF1002 domain-containing protein n=1 Tax=Aerococcus urinae (strain CCUG 59500 / ACS-120-V-Col10a) TaxID=2976812 RepID=UPI000200E592|nr:DUF1002 domain-containing protein [Aerococcus sp. Group 1]AEA00737.1 hypothetical protein HMPREF9243_1701 [Aerococcus sp. Group 1]MCY3030058.1 DUF1002 domain-containing protein [Aerococcus sp. Group 1]MCY3054371.1 DUF1002 domain-containing protein [Aerococcus sp. Group 1]MCY3056101.1 DUF1002 domain-containing protein [Aerococcus sp. Group 1]MCY3061144.1 DUF1002 domain-containing protein [Aerococcus sp. Group 1]
MNQLKRGLLAVLACLMAIALFIPQTSAQAAIKESIFTYGESLNQSQFQETQKLLGVDTNARAVQVNINELNGLLHDNYPYYQVYSSAYIAPAKHSGVNVEIVTPKTITAITPLQYENAALTAGATNVDIKVASAVQVDGSGALAGVYKAFQDSGQALDGKAVSVAQEELQTASTITKENQNKENYSDETLNAAIADMKNQIQQAKEQNGGSIDGNTIQVIVNNVINNYNLNGVLSEENIQQLRDLMTKFSQIELTEEQKNALSNFGQTLKEKSGQLVDSAKSAWDNMDETDKNGITDFFHSLWQSLLGIWDSIFGTNYGQNNQGQ